MNTDYLKFCPKLKEIIESGQSLNQRGETVEIRAVSTLGNIRVIRELLLRERFSNTLEIGLAFGGSALTFLSTLKETSPKQFQHTAIDPFQTKVWGGSSVRVISEEGFAENFTLYEDFSALALPELLKDRKRFDLIYIDGSHLFEDVFLDFYYASRLLKQNGIMLFDDCTDRHVQKVIKFIRGNYAQFLSEIDYSVYDDPEKPLKKKIGNRMGVRQLCGFRKKNEPPRDWNSPLSRF